jgi:hypothetical protein
MVQNQYWLYEIAENLCRLQRTGLVQVFAARAEVFCLPHAAHSDFAAGHSKVRGARQWRGDGACSTRQRNSKTRAKCTAKGIPLRGIEFLPEPFDPRHRQGLRMNESFDPQRVGHGQLDGGGWNGPASKLPEERATRRLNPHPSHEPTTRRMGHPACQVYWEDGADNVISISPPKDVHNGTDFECVSR